jgi:pyridoxal phosphate enzyme (YggS family)
MIAENLQQLHTRIDQACRRCGRDAGEIQLIAVSKTVSADSIREALECGIQDFGENYVQELNEKRIGLSAPPLRWHFIGHLQSNKVKYIAEYVHLVHSVDDAALGREISKRAERCGKIQDVLVEVHTTGEATKEGIAPEKTVELVRQLSAFKNLHVCGLMTMGPLADDPEASRSSFRQLADLKRTIEKENIENVAMRHLSMGMSHDFEIAIEEGATMIRIGTAIFGARFKKTL